MNPTPNYHAQDAKVATELRRRSIASQIRRDQTDPAHIATRAAKHRADAEAHLQFVALGHDEHRAMADRAFQFAYEEEN